jgi:hypothetical protein
MMNWKITAIGAALVALMVACPQPADLPQIDLFKVQALNTQDAPNEAINLPPGGGDVKFNWVVKNFDKLSIDNGVGDVSSLTEKTNVKVTQTTTYTLSATKGGGAPAKKTVTVNVGGGKKITVTVKRFNGEAAVGYTVSIGDESATTRVSKTTNDDGKVDFEGVSDKYIITALPPQLTEELPVSYKAVTTNNPVIVIEPRNGFVTACQREEGYIRFRLGGDSVVTSGQVGYAYFVSDKGKNDAIHEDSLLSNSVAVLKPGQRGGIIRVRFSQNSCPSSVTGKIVYLQRDTTSYTFSGVTSTQTIQPGAITPATGAPIIVPIGQANAQSVSGTITIPTGFTKGQIFPVIKVGSGSAIVADPRDINNVARQGGSGTNTYSFSLPATITGVEYRIGVTLTDDTGKFTSWYYSENIAPIPGGGLVRNLTSLPTTFNAAQPSGVKGIVTPEFFWTPSSPANLYYIGWGKVQNCAVATSPKAWTGVSVGGTASELTRFKLPALPLPADMELGTDAEPCVYNWSAANAINLREASPDSDKMLDGRLVLKRLYRNVTTTGNFDFNHVVPVRFVGASPEAATDAQVIYRDEQAETRLGIAPLPDYITKNTSALAAGVSDPNLIAPVVADANDLRSATPVASRESLNDDFSRYSVGPINNPDEVANGVLNANFQELRLKVGGPTQ